MNRNAAGVLLLVVGGVYFWRKGTFHNVAAAATGKMKTA
jgi:hypothetical protein